MEDTGMNWRKASYTNGGENCVETASDSGEVLVRDTKDRDGGTLSFPEGTWQAFVTGLKRSLSQDSKRRRAASGVNRGRASGFVAAGWSLGRTPS
jgi:hypothetical protein